MKNVLKDAAREWLIALIKQAGDVAMHYYMGQFEVYQKPDGSIVTTADLEVNRVVTEGIRTHVPDEPVLSEETPDDLTRLKANTVWLVDPIDGTSLFARNSAEFGILIGRCHQGVSIESSAFFPALGLTVYSRRGDGCFVNGQRVRVSGRVFEDARISAYGKEFESFKTWSRAYYLPALEIVQLCLGEIDGCVLDASRAGEHDYAWAPCAVEEAGGRITDAFGNELRFNKPERTVPPVVVAGNPAVHQELLRRVQNVLGR
ncbi:MAG TPA: inositol monophosphatase family protein [Candidatus Hydrogenedentes bacterium]|nr:inositol monophosphatase family protein [Candidatus Hydrogenedentota bacterium]HOL76315.1 inositol monophosphatase family protein [Candidatus Hydrogenedentota bacterium]HPO86143.1 inositol monophosphatase family protein [Candidatus Hydrogenedentota bacterium]